MARAEKSKIDIKATNKKAKFEYKFLAEYEAGLVLTGTEIKSIRNGLINLRDAFCYFINGELYVKSMYIGEYSHGNIQNHETRGLRKLLLRKTEIKKISKKSKEKGNSIIPYQLYITERGYAKLLITLATGKKSYDKRNTIKDRDDKRIMDRAKKEGW
jgi:SsrA-binding protein